MTPGGSVGDAQEESSPQVALKLVRAPFTLAALGLGFAAAALFSMGLALLGTITGIRDFPDKLGSTLAAALTPLPARLAPSWIGEAGGRVGLLLVLSSLAWAVTLWAIFAVAISRIDAMRLTTGRSIGVREALGFATSNARSAILFAFTVGLTLAILLIGNALAGVVAQIPYVGPIALIVAFPFAFVAMIIATLVGVGAALGSGLATASLADERNGALDAISRTYSYIYSRPHHALLYLALIALFALGLHVAGNVFIVDGTLASLRLLAFGDVSRAVYPAVVGDVPLKDVVAFPESLAALFLSLSVWLGRQVVLGAVIAYGIGATTSAYLLLRRDVDGIPEDEIAPSEPTPPPPAEGPPRAAVGPVESPGASAPPTG